MQVGDQSLLDEAEEAKGCSRLRQSGLCHIVFLYFSEKRYASTKPHDNEMQQASGKLSNSRGSGPAQML